MQNKIYTVTTLGSGYYSIRDTQTGSQVGRFNVPGQLVSGPIVAGNTCSITTRTGNVNTTYVVSLPSGHLTNRFVA